MWNRGCGKSFQKGCSGFTLLELIISMTIISMVVLVLYYSFSVGSRVWEGNARKTDQPSRLEAALRLFNNDMTQAVPYNMNWEKGNISLFSGGPNAMFYVTGNGTGSFSGPGAGLYFSLMFVDHCPDNNKKCLYLYKTPRPESEFIREVDRFRSAGEFGRENFIPESKIADKSIPVLTQLESLEISYSHEDFKPFEGSGREVMSQKAAEEESLAEDHWQLNELPGQAKISFVLDDREYSIQVPVGY